MSRFAVIDTETTWYDRVMSVGAVIADSATLQPVETRYYILDPEFREGGCTLRRSSCGARTNTPLLPGRRRWTISSPA